jgi:hypothetical protein
MRIMNIEWEIKFPAITAYCHGCRTSYLIEFVTPTRSIKHCGGRTRLPEKIYERWIAVKENKLTGKRYAPEIGKEPPTAGDGNNPSSSKVPSKLDFNVKYF